MFRADRFVRTAVLQRFPQLCVQMTYPVRSRENWLIRQGPVISVLAQKSMELKSPCCSRNDGVVGNHIKARYSQSHITRPLDVAIHNSSSENFMSKRKNLVTSNYSLFWRRRSPVFCLSENGKSTGTRNPNRRCIYRLAQSVDCLFIPAQEKGKNWKKHAIIYTRKGTRTPARPRLSKRDARPKAQGSRKRRG